MSKRSRNRAGNHRPFSRDVGCIKNNCNNWSKDIVNVIPQLIATEDNEKLM